MMARWLRPTTRHLSALMGAVLAFALYVCWPAPGHAETLQSLFTSGNAAVFQGDLDGAIARYNTLVESGVRDPDVYFNLATAHGRKGELGYAVLYFERAQRLSPGDEEVEKFLAATREALAQRAAARTGEATVRTRPTVREALVAGVSADTLSVLLLLFNLLCFGSLLLRRFSRGEAMRVATLVSASLTGLCALLALAGLAVKLGTGKPGDSVVIVDSQALREGPADSAQTRGEVEEGSLAYALAQEGRWVRVRVIDGEDGWLPSTAVGRIDPD